MTLLYCIKHEATVAVSDPDKYMGHCEQVEISEHPFIDIDCCEFPLGFAYCAPPEVPTMDDFLFETIMSELDTVSNMEQLR